MSLSAARLLWNSCAAERGSIVVSGERGMLLGYDAIQPRASAEHRFSAKLPDVDPKILRRSRILRIDKCIRAGFSLAGQGRILSRTLVLLPDTGSRAFARGLSPDQIKAIMNQRTKTSIKQCHVQPAATCQVPGAHCNFNYKPTSSGQCVYAS